MDANRAAEVLRDPGNHGPEEKLAARDAAIQAMEAWAWVERTGADVTKQSGKWHCAVGWFTHTIHDTPLAAVLNAMEKEKGNG
jgi:hypothetical protein